MTNHVPMSERPSSMVTVDGSKLILSVNHQNVLSIHKSAIHLVGEMEEIKGE